MRAFLWPLALLACPLFAQDTGVTPEWETRKLLESLVANSKKLLPLVEQIHPAEWMEKGAPDAYQQQWERVRDSVAILQSSSEKLYKEPTRLSLALETLYRLESLGVYLNSLSAGVRRYQNPALADVLASVSDENSNNHATLKQYLLELASSREMEMKVMEAEAQRCVGIIAKQPPRPAKPVQSKPAAPSPAKPKERP